MGKSQKIFPNHKSEINRINRVQGQIEGIKRMIEEKRYCMDILVQTRAVISAIRALEGAILRKHLGNCVTNAFRSGNKKDSDVKIQEILDLFQRCSVN